MMMNNNNNSAKLSGKSSLIDSSKQLSFIHQKPFRVSQSVINFKDKFLQPKNLINAYRSLHVWKGYHNLRSTLRLTENYHLFERNLISKLLDSDENIFARKVLEQMWRTSQFCDLIFIVQGTEYLAHRFVLAENSNKFKQLFHKRKSDFVTRIHLRYPTHHSLQVILNYLYTDNITLTMRNVKDVLTCTKELGVEKIIDLCASYLSQVDHRTVFQILEIACKHDLSEVYHRAHQFLSQSMDECIQTKEFIDISYWMLNYILSDETIENRQEFQILDRTLQWLSCNRVSNTEAIFELLHNIRWKNLSYLSLKEILATNYEILHSASIKQWLVKKLKDLHGSEIKKRRQDEDFLLTVAGDKTKSNHENILVKLPSPTSFGFYLTLQQPGTLASSLFKSSSETLVIGGGFHLNKTMTVNENTENGLFAYNLDKDVWSLFTRLPDQRHHHKLVWFNGRIYVLGGSISHPFEKEQVASTNWSFAIDRSDQWQAVPSMLQQRVYFGCAVMNNKIWVVGGLGLDGKLIRSIEYYDPEINAWKLAKRLRSPRLGCAVTACHPQLFIVGGYCHVKPKSILSNVTVYDSNQNIWLRKQPLPIARCHGQLITHFSSFYLIGGYTELKKNEDETVDLLDKYEPRQDRWITQTRMQPARHDLCAEIIGDRIFVMNGVNSNRNLILKSMESYDINTSVWTTLTSHSNDYVIGAASCVVTTSNI